MPAGRLGHDPPGSTTITLSNSSPLACRTVSTHDPARQVGSLAHGRGRHASVTALPSSSTPPGRHDHAQPAVAELGRLPCDRGGQPGQLGVAPARAHGGTPVSRTERRRHERRVDLGQHPAGDAP